MSAQRSMSFSGIVLATGTAVITAAAPAGAADVQWLMGGFTATGDQQVEQAIERVTGGAIEVDVRAPGDLVHPLELLDAVTDGRADVGAAPLGLWARQIPAAALFTAVPFGPDAPEYLAWIAHGGGREIHDEILAQHGIHALPCGINVPEASGWFREEITSLDDLQGLKMRFFGLGALAMAKLGVETVTLAPGDILPALESGEVDAAEFSTPSTDLTYGFHTVAKHYYFPGWHQPYTIIDLMIGEEAWSALSDTQKAQVEAACASVLLAGLAEGEASQSAALEQLEAEGVQIHRWPPEMLQAFAHAWAEVAAEQAEKDPEFARAWDSLNQFRTTYAAWSELATVE